MSFLKNGKHFWKTNGQFLTTFYADYDGRNGFLNFCDFDQNNLKVRYTLSEYFSLRTDLWTETRPGGLIFDT